MDCVERATQGSKFRAEVSDGVLKLSKGKLWICLRKKLVADFICRWKQYFGTNALFGKGNLMMRIYNLVEDEKVQALLMECLCILHNQ